jgi:predicted nucleic acid-binding protein
MLQTPVTLWREATKNGQRCRDKGIQTGALDLLIATICNYYRVALVTFDASFEKIANMIGFEVELIKKPDVHL